MILKTSKNCLTRSIFTFFPRFVFFKLHSLIPGTQLLFKSFQISFALELKSEEKKPQILLSNRETLIMLNIYG